MCLLTVQLQFKCFTVLYTIFTFMLHSDMLFPAAGSSVELGGSKFS
jgi:hypothetical protein